jgi:hypothetical protein
MTGPHRSRSTLASSSTVLFGVLTLAVLSAIGAVISVAGDLSPNLVDAMGPEGRLSIPLPMTVAQVVMAIAARSTRRPLALIGSGFVAAALLLGVVSGFFDGGYADDRLTGLQRGYQIIFVAALAVVGSLAAVRFTQALRAGGLARRAAQGVGGAPGA